MIDNIQRDEDRETSNDVFDENINIDDNKIINSIGIIACVRKDVETIKVEINYGIYKYNRGYWEREPVKIIQNVRLFENEIKLKNKLKLSIYVQEHKINKIIRIILSNDNIYNYNKNNVEKYIFQPEIILKSKDNTDKKIFYNENDIIKDNELDILYKNKVDIAQGNNIGVKTIFSDEDPLYAKEIKTQIMPTCELESMVPAKLECINNKEQKNIFNIRRIAKLALITDKKLTDEKEFIIKELYDFADSYDKWIKENKKNNSKINNLNFDNAFNKCENLLNRIKEGIKLLKDEDKAFAAFCLTNLIMFRQMSRNIYKSKFIKKEEIKNKLYDISWYPFQLAFLLINIPELYDPTHKNRSGENNDESKAILDLLWIPTGGGKTEAYFAVSAFTMIIRRINYDLGEYYGGKGVTVIMRYTLRLLTVQQFQRASTLICAMEIIRKNLLSRYKQKDSKKFKIFDNIDIKGLICEPFSIGLWIGLKEYMPHIDNENEKDNYIMNCPWCGHEINVIKTIEQYKCEYCKDIMNCSNEKCIFHFINENEPMKIINNKLPLPIITPKYKDESQIYRTPPSMIIATVDKFAIMAWKNEIANLFNNIDTTKTEIQCNDNKCYRHDIGLDNHGRCLKNDTNKKNKSLKHICNISQQYIRPPDLIIQDELHLISGPLGSVFGLYEVVIDLLSTWEIKDKNGNIKSVYPKVIASTATVNSIDKQVKEIFFRKTSIFPAQGINIDDNFFLKRESIDQKFGRRYIGLLCTNSFKKYRILSNLYSSLLKNSKILFNRFDKNADQYMTLIGYFNRLKDLGNMQRIINNFSIVNNLKKVDRNDITYKEITSKASNEEIKKIINKLEINFYDKINKEKPLDIAITSNMFSVGIDVKRLGLMVLYGMPNNTTEYIQSISRIGRFKPGLVFTFLNSGNNRDRKYYNKFEYYHNIFYKDVEIQSVTPFTPMVIDYALSSAFISYVRMHKYRKEELRELTFESVSKIQKEFLEKIKKRTKHQNKEYINKKIGKRINELAEKINNKEYNKYISGKSTKSNIISKNNKTKAILNEYNKDENEQHIALNSMRSVEGLIKITIKINEKEKILTSIRDSQVIHTYGPGSIINLSKYSVMINEELLENISDNIKNKVKNIINEINIKQNNKIEEKIIHTLYYNKLIDTIDFLKSIDKKYILKSLDNNIHDYKQQLNELIKKISEKKEIKETFKQFFNENNNNCLKLNQNYEIYKDPKIENIMEPPFIYFQDKPNKDPEKYKIPAEIFPLWFICKNCKTLFKLEEHNNKGNYNKNIEFDDRDRLNIICDHCKENKNTSSILYFVACSMGKIFEFPWDDFINNEGFCDSGKENSYSDTNYRYKVYFNNEGEIKKIEKIKKDTEKIIKSVKNINFNKYMSEDSTIKTYLKKWCCTKCKKYKDYKTEYPKGNFCCSGEIRVLNTLSYYSLFSNIAHLTDIQNINEQIDENICEKYENKIKSIKTADKTLTLQSLITYSRVINLNEEYYLNIDKDNKVLSYTVLLGKYQQKYNNYNENQYFVIGNRLFGEYIKITLNKKEIEIWKNKIKTKIKNIKIDDCPEIMLHTLSHILIKEISINCGYDMSILREQINTKKNEIIIYLNTYNPYGTFGGLVELAKNGKIFKILDDAIENIKYCPSDPICLTSHIKSSCPFCLHIPDISCYYEPKDKNKKLNRHFITKISSKYDYGFFD